MRAPPSPLQCCFSFLVQYQVPSASTWWIMPTFILHVFNFQTSAFMLSLRQSSNALGRRPPQIFTKLLRWSHLLALSVALPLRACLWSQDLFIAPLVGQTMVFSFLFVPLSFCSYPVVFCVFYSPCKLVKKLYSWGVYTAHTDQWGLWTCQGHLGATVMQIIVIIKVQ